MFTDLITTWNTLSRQTLLLFQYLMASLELSCRTSGIPPHSHGYRAWNGCYSGKCCGPMSTCLIWRSVGWEKTRAEFSHCGRWHTVYSLFGVVRLLSLHIDLNTSTWTHQVCFIAILFFHKNQNTGPLYVRNSHFASVLFSSSFLPLSWSYLIANVSADLYSRDELCAWFRKKWFDRSGTGGGPCLWFSCCGRTVV